MKHAEIGSRKLDNCVNSYCSESYSVFCYLLIYLFINRFVYLFTAFFLSFLNTDDDTFCDAPEMNARSNE